MDYQKDLGWNMEQINCNCEIINKTLITVLLVITFMCLYTKKENINTIKKLKIENDTLGSIILKSVDKVFINMLKNGSDYDSENEE